MACEKDELPELNLKFGPLDLDAIDSMITDKINLKLTLLNEIKILKQKKPIDEKRLEHIENLIFEVQYATNKLIDQERNLKKDKVNNINH